MDSLPKDDYEEIVSRLSKFVFFEYEIRNKVRSEKRKDLI